MATLSQTKKQMIKDPEYLQHFEQKVEEELLKLCTSYEMLDGTLLGSEDIDNLWTALAPEYVADAVPNIQDYPVVSLAWAMYLGMGVAYGWDADWEKYGQAPYKSYYGEQGFDDMDEHIVRDILRIPLESRTAKELEDMARRCGQTALTLIRNERIEPSTPTAFHVYARAIKVMYRLGAAMQLRRMGYKFERMK